MYILEKEDVPMLICCAGIGIIVIAMGIVF